MFKIKDDCDLVIKIGDKEIIITPGSNETIKREPSPGITRGTLTFECEEFGEISTKCEMNFKEGTLRGEYNNCTIEGKFDPASVEWVHV